MVVLPHGGPYGVRDWWEFDPEVQLLASRGYAVLQVNYRGSGFISMDFERAGYREWGGKMQDDLTDATHWAIQQKIAAPDRICIYGASYGGYAALMGVVREPDLYRCAIGYAGIYDLELRLESGALSDSHRGKAFLERSLGTRAADTRHGGRASRFRAREAHEGRAREESQAVRVPGAERRGAWSLRRDNPPRSVRADPAVPVCQSQRAPWNSMTPSSTLPYLSIMMSNA
jgi:pimeloyl-ACP methyl ester carboxylesterase